MLKRMWREDEGVLTFEWILLTTLLVIGLVGAMSGVRDAINSELTDVAAAMVSLDQSYSICSPIDNCVTIPCKDGAVGSLWNDAAAIGLTRQDGTTRQQITTLDCTK
jgi:Flp pilus assembly pilin Flp